MSAAARRRVAIGIASQSTADGGSSGHVRLVVDVASPQDGVTDDEAYGPVIAMLMDSPPSSSGTEHALQTEYLETVEHARPLTDFLRTGAHLERGVAAYSVDAERRCYALATGRLGMVALARAIERRVLDRLHLRVHTPARVAADFAGYDRIVGFAAGFEAAAPTDVVDLREDLLRACEAFNAVVIIHRGGAACRLVINAPKDAEDDDQFNRWAAAPRDRVLADNPDGKRFIMCDTIIDDADVLVPWVGGRFGFIPPLRDAECIFEFVLGSRSAREPRVWTVQYGDEPGFPELGDVDLVVGLGAAGAAVAGDDKWERGSASEPRSTFVHARDRVWRAAFFAPRS